MPKPKTRPISLDFPPATPWPDGVEGILKSVVPADQIELFRQQGVRISLRFQSPFPKPKKAKKEVTLPDGFEERLEASIVKPEDLKELLKDLNTPQLKKLAKTRALVLHEAKRVEDVRSLVFEALRSPEVWRAIAGVATSSQSGGKSPDASDDHSSSRQSPDA